MKKTTAIIGASGYTGSELLRLLTAHPELELVAATAHSLAGKKVCDVYPHLHCYGNLHFASADQVSEKLAEADLVFSALPHGKSMEVLPGLKAKSLVDLGSDFRLKEESLYDQWYGRPHICPKQLGDWTYGLCELFKDKIVEANKIANPGCYPTAVSLALAPLLKEGLIEEVIQVDAVSGVSGAGRVPGEKVHFSHVDENFSAYKVTAHQHTPEIEMAINSYASSTAKVSFTAHLAPMVRGIHATSSAQVKDGVDQKKLQDCLQAAYSSSHFVYVIEGQPQTKAVTSSNCALINAKLDNRTGRAIVTSVIDNLVKGAAGQAIQNANIILGMPEETGLPVSGLYP